jgi:hypothetical protein
MPAAGRESDRGQRTRDRLAATIKDKSVLVLSFVTLLGVTLVAAGWIIQGRAYVPGALLTLGASLMLLVPLAMLGFMLETRLRHAEEQIRAATVHLDTLTAVTRERLTENRRQREELFKKAKSDPSQEIIYALLSDSFQIGAIAPSGVRVHITETTLRLRFRTQDGHVQAQVEELDGTPLESVHWNIGETADVFAQRLSRCLSAIGRHPGEPTFDPSSVFQQLLDTLDLGVKARTGEHPRDLGHIIEIPNEQWVVSAEGLYALSIPYSIPKERIVDSHENWSRHMRTLAWVDAAAFDEAYRLARQLLRREAAHQERRDN